VVREPLLRACFEASRVEGVVPLGVLFDATCTMGEEVELTWDFDDGGQSDQRDVVHTFREPGVYNVILTATDAGGRTDTESLTITATAP
jgi:PKD repeat protein